MPTLSPRKKWDHCLEIIKCNVSQEEYDALFARITFDSMVVGEGTQPKLFLGVPSYGIGEQLDREKKFKYLLHNVVWQVYGDTTLIIYRVLVDSTTKATADIAVVAGNVPTEKVNTRTKRVQTLPQEDDGVQSNLNEEMTFDTFVEGEGNKLLRSVGLSIAEKPQQSTFNPLFVYGDSGVGKTHLVNAIGVEYKRNCPGGKVIYVPANLFKVQYMKAKEMNEIAGFVEFYQTFDMLIIDDIQELETAKKTQMAFFHIFNHLKMNGRKIILSSDRAPETLPGFEARMLTRFTWGLAAELQKPDFDLCRRILLSKIQRNGLQIGADVVDYIALNVKDNVRDLEGILNSLMAYSIVFSHKVDMKMAVSVVGRTMKQSKRDITIDMIVEKACDFFGITEAQLVDKGRKANVVTVRQLVMFMAHKHTKLTDGRIGMRLGGRNHATVIHAVKQTQNRLSTDKDFQDKVAQFEAELTA